MRDADCYYLLQNHKKYKLIWGFLSKQWITKLVLRIPESTGLHEVGPEQELGSRGCDDGRQRRHGRRLQGYFFLGGGGGVWVYALGGVQGRRLSSLRIEAFTAQGPEDSEHPVSKPFKALSPKP